MDPFMSSFRQDFLEAVWVVPQLMDNAANMLLDFLNQISIGKPNQQQLTDLQTHSWAMVEALTAADHKWRSYYAYAGVPNDPAYAEVSGICKHTLALAVTLLGVSLSPDFATDLQVPELETSYRDLANQFLELADDYRNYHFEML